MKNTMRRIGRKILAGMLGVSLIAGGLESKASGADSILQVGEYKYSVYEAQESMNRYASLLPQRATNFARAITGAYEKGEIESRDAVSEAYVFLGKIENACNSILQTKNSGLGADFSLDVLQERLLSEGNTNDAKIVSRKLVDLYKGGKISYNSWGMLGAGKAYELLGDTKRAIEVYENAIKCVASNGGNDDAFRYPLTSLYLDMGDNKTAAEVYSKVKQRDNSLDSRFSSKAFKDISNEFSKTLKVLNGGIK